MGTLWHSSSDQIIHTRSRAGDKLALSAELPSICSGVPVRISEARYISRVCYGGCTIIRFHSIPSASSRGALDIQLLLPHTFDEFGSSLDLYGPRTLAVAQKFSTEASY